jgi:flagellar hook assembly protein FlgD
LKQNYPNPFNPKTTILYTVGANGHSPLQQVDLSIYNILGQKVATLVNKKQPAGSYQVQWDATGFATGVYYYKIEAGEYLKVKKMILIR